MNWQIKVAGLYQWRREMLVRAFFYMGMAIAFLGSLNPWFMWPIGIYYIILASFFLLFSIGLSFPMSGRYYNYSNALIPTLLFAVLAFYQSFVRAKDINSYIADVFHIIIFFSLFCAKFEDVRKFCNILSKIMGGFLAVSIFFFLLYLLGFPLPSRDANFLTTYSYSNYYFFLLDDRSLFTIIPRFHSVFLEPGHMGTMTTMLLFTQIGKWKKWYNIVMIVATLISFSLAAYGLFVGVVFLGLWVRGKHFVKKALCVIGLFAAITVGSFYYNNGNNLLHDLIMIRLEISDGEMAGDNRVTDDFEADYESLLQSADVFVGRDRNTESFGNSGFRVFIYDYGLIGLFLVVVFYIVALYNPQYFKAMTAAFVISALNFIIRGYPLWYANFIPIYCVAKCAFYIQQTNQKVDT